MAAMWRNSPRKCHTNAIKISTWPPYDSHAHGVATKIAASPPSGCPMATPHGGHMAILAPWGRHLALSIPPSRRHHVNIPPWGRHLANFSWQRHMAVAIWQRHLAATWPPLGALVLFGNLLKIIEFRK